MRNYLSLASIQAKVHKKQNLMTIFCIALAVILITGVFTMSDMEYRHELIRMAGKHGNWHICLHEITEEEGNQVIKNSDVKFSSWYDIINYSAQNSYTLNKTPITLCGTQKGFNQITNVIEEGRFPKKDNEIALSMNAKRLYNLNIGDLVFIKTPVNDYEFKITGFCENTDKILAYETIGSFITMNELKNIAYDNGIELNPVLYIQFRNTFTIRKSIDSIKSNYGWDNNQVSENTAMLGVLGMSSNNYVVGIYGVGIALVVLVMLAGILMIAGSMNSNISQRTQYFGMLRCIGTSKAQIKRIVRLEALNWCKIAIPLGIIIATLASWGICAVLRYLIGGEWDNMPVGEISYVGIISGTLCGIITVLISANSPARKAARVTPVSAITGNYENNNVKNAANTSLLKIEKSLGIHNAIANKKSLILTTGSFALSIILFLSFSVMIDWISHALNTNKPYTPDMSIFSEEYGSVITKEFADNINQIEGVKKVYGRMYSNLDVIATKDISKIDLISYEDSQFNWAKDDLLKGDIEKVKNQNNCVMVVFDKNNPLELGDKLIVNNTELEVVAVLKDSPFSSSDIPAVICSENTFSALTGIDNYAVLEIQVNKKADKDIDLQIRERLSDDLKLSDRRESKKQVNSTYFAFCLLVYGFLSIIALISIFNIINNISMSVSAKSKQYGIMRAIGMDNKQIRRMIWSEAFSYAISGCIVGGILGIFLHIKFYTAIITNYFGDSWRIPIKELFIILIVIIFATVISTFKPTKRILENTVTEAISEL